MSTWIATESARLLSNFSWALVRSSVARCSFWREMKKMAISETTINSTISLEAVRHSRKLRSSSNPFLEPRHQCPGGFFFS